MFTGGIYSFKRRLLIILTTIRAVIKVLIWIFSFGEFCTGILSSELSSNISRISADLFLWRSLTRVTQVVLTVLGYVSNSGLVLALIDYFIACPKILAFQIKTIKCLVSGATLHSLNAGYTHCLLIKSCMVTMPYVSAP